METEKWIRNTTHVTEEKYTVHTNVYDFPGEKDKRRYRRRRVVFSGDSCTLYWWMDRISAGYFWKHVHLVSPSLASAAGRERHVLIEKICCIKAWLCPIWPSWGWRGWQLASMLMWSRWVTGDDDDGVRSHVRSLSRPSSPFLIIPDSNKRAEYSLIRLIHSDHCWHLANQPIIAFCGQCQWMAEG